MSLSFFQATKKLNAFADFEDDDVEMDNDSDNDSDASDFDEDEDPDKIEVPGEWSEAKCD